MEFDDGTMLPGGADKQPAEDDRRLLRDVLAAIGIDVIPECFEAGARALHRARRQREKELRNHLKKVGGQAEARKFQLITLNKAHATLKRRHHRKHADCEILKRALFDANYPRERIIAMLSGRDGNATPSAPDSAPTADLGAPEGPATAAGAGEWRCESCGLEVDDRHLVVGHTRNEYVEGQPVPLSCGPVSRVAPPAAGSREATPHEH